MDPGLNGEDCPSVGPEQPERPGPGGLLGPTVRTDQVTKVTEVT